MVGKMNKYEFMNQTRWSGSIQSKLSKEELKELKEDLINLQ